MFIYNLNEKGLKKFEKDINEQIKENGVIKFEYHNELDEVITK